MIIIKDISIGDANKSGIKNQHSIMDNGEKRFRQICLKDRTAYIRAEGGPIGYWQNSHYHKSIREIYIVQKGSILLAQYINGKIQINKIEKDGIFNVSPNVPHNIYMYPNTVLHTVKYGEVEEYDWQEFEKLDKILKKKTIKELKKYIK